MTDTALAPTYLVKTLGCQMNVHDSEHMAGLLEGAGYIADGFRQFVEPLSALR